MWLIRDVEYLNIQHAIEYKKTFIGKKEIFQVFVEFWFVFGISFLSTTNLEPAKENRRGKKRFHSMSYEMGFRFS